ncbi:MAG: hypothetical protein H0X37_07190 [Herpetosiphonaceae bacterium]|jgi:hypothetical protein|nr:hypothetical protein [Herpetosiphonaceae bacterium]
MSDATTVTYTCGACGWVNTWTRDEIVQRGDVVVYKAVPSAKEDRYSLKCRNPKFNCPGHEIVAVERKV